MKQCLTFLSLLVFPLLMFSQHAYFQKTFEHFEESRGNATNGYIVTLPYKETVVLTNPLNSSSGLGPTFNYYGTVVVVDQMNLMPNGEMQLVLRREDGRNFYGFEPTLKAILSKNEQLDTTKINNN